MPITLEDGLLDAVEAEGGDLVLVVRPAGPAMTAAAQKAALLVASLDHPEEPGEPWPSLVRVEELDGLPAVRIDLKDRQAWPGISAVLVGVLVGALAEAGGDAVVGLARRQDEPAGADGWDVGATDEDEDEDDEPDDGDDDEGLEGLTRMPWPSGHVPPPTRRSPLMSEALVLRPVSAVVEEMAEAFASHGRLTGRATVRGAEAHLLLGEQNGSEWIVSLLPTHMVTRVFVTEGSWASFVGRERRRAEASLDWSVRPTEPGD